MTTLALGKSATLPLWCLLGARCQTRSYVAKLSARSGVLIRLESVPKWVSTSRLLDAGHWLWADVYQVGGKTTGFAIVSTMGPLCDGPRRIAGCSRVVAKPGGGMIAVALSSCQPPKAHHIFACDGKEDHLGLKLKCGRDHDRHWQQQFSFRWR